MSFLLLLALASWVLMLAIRVSVDYDRIKTLEELAHSQQSLLSSMTRDHVRLVREVKELQTKRKPWKSPVVIPLSRLAEEK